MNAEALLGPLPFPWTSHYHMIDCCFRPRYYNEETKITSTEDPRLGLLEPGWKRVVKDRDPDSPFHSDHFWNAENDMYLNSDPRMLPKALEKRGVKLERFQLV